jgi:hypothetical protein
MIHVALVLAAMVHLVNGASTYTATSVHAPTVTNQNPLPGSHLRTFYPQFSARIDTHGGAPLSRASVHLFLDGADVTPAASISQNIVNYVPRSRVSSGWHDVFLEGADTAGQRFSDAWVFQLEAPDVNVSQLDGGFGFFPVGNPQFGGFMHFVLIAPTDGFATLQLCGIPQVAFLHVRLSPVFFLTVPVNIVDGFSPFFGCNVGAFFSPFNGFNQFNNVFIPLPFGIAGPTVQPNIPIPPAAKTRRIMPVYRSAEIPVGGAPMTMPAPQSVITTPRNIMPIYRTVPLPYGVAMPPGTRAAAPTTVSGSRAVLPVYRAAPPRAAVKVPAPPPPQPIPH